MYMGYHIPLSFAVTLRSKKLKSFLEKKKCIKQLRKQSGKAPWPSSGLQPRDKSLTIFGDKKKCDALRSLNSPVRQSGSLLRCLQIPRSMNHCLSLVRFIIADFSG